MNRVLALAGLLTVGGAVAAQQNQARPPLPDLVKVKDNLYVIGSSTPGNEFTGGNVGVLVGANGVTVVDTKLSNYGPSIIEKIKKVTDKPITTIINTHTHGDHTGSNEGFPNVEIVAHENTKANMAKMPAFKDDKAKFLPSKTYKDKLSVGRGKDRIDLYYFGPGTPTATRGSITRRWACCRPATCSRGATRRRSIAPTPAAASSTRRRSRRRSPGSKTSTP